MGVRKEHMFSTSYLMQPKGGRIVEMDERTNVEKLAAFVEEEEASLLPAFLALLEMCFHSQEHSLEKF